MSATARFTTVLITGVIGMDTSLGIGDIIGGIGTVAIGIVAIGIVVIGTAADIESATKLHVVTACRHDGGQVPWRFAE